jgi:hypothetical protein
MQRIITCIGSLSNVDLATVADTRMRFTESNRRFVITQILVAAKGTIGTITDPAYIAVGVDSGGISNYYGPTQLVGGMSTGEVSVITPTAGWVSPMPTYSDVYFRVTTAAVMGAGACRADVYIFGYYIA